jgi:predicted transport protein
MSDIKLFRFEGEGVVEIEGQSVAVEKCLQTTIEKHLEDFFGVRFLASEYGTGKTHSGRIDTLRIDENGCPVILEYKRATNENVINQGLFYLDWLLDHKGEFTLLVMRTLGKDAADKIEWTAPRLLCIAGDFTRYDEHAVQQINLNIELIRYRRYGKDHILFELVNATTAQEIDETKPTGATKARVVYKTVSEYLTQAKPELKDLFESLKSFLMAMGDDVQMKELKYYVAFKRLKNFACVEAHPQAGKLLVFVKINPDKIELKKGFTRDVRNIGHFGTGDVEITLASPGDLEQAKPMLLQSYEAS